MPKLRLCRAAAFAAILLLAVIVAAPAQRAAAADLRQQLPGTAWTLVEWAGATPTPAGKASLEFAAAGAIGGSGFCNRYVGTVSFLDGKVQLETTGWTKMWCGDANMLDMRFAADLKRTVRLDLADGVLAAYDAAGTVIFRFRRAESRTGR